jgi:hypothetical protein
MTQSPTCSNNTSSWNHLEQVGEYPVSLPCVDIPMDEGLAIVLLVVGHCVPLLCTLKSMFCLV